MAAFSELIRSFDKIRDYMKDFYIYGFKQRSDFDQKSARTYDNEKRRIESYLGEYVGWSYDKHGKRTFISLDSADIPANPLYAAWKSKTFTARDIMLHFYILDCLREDGLWLSVEAITDQVSLQSGQIFDTQTVRLKCGEYVRQGLLKSEKRGRAFYYALDTWEAEAPAEGKAVWRSLINAVKFYQEMAPFGEVGSFFLDNQRERNDMFRFKHHYIVHTLEDGVLMDVLTAIRRRKQVIFVNQSPRSGVESILQGVPATVFSSAVTGRRYLCLYMPARRRFATYRLDYIKSVEMLEEGYDKYEEIRQALERNKPRVWGVSFGGRSRNEILCMKLAIDEKEEKFVLDRLKREGRGGEILRLEENLFLYTKEIYDTNEMAPWIKTFTGRIVALEGSNRLIIDKFYRDMEAMEGIYREAPDEELLREVGL